MVEVEVRDVVSLSVPAWGSVQAAPEVCWVVADPKGRRVEPVYQFMVELTATGSAPSTRRSYCYDLLRWWRFCQAVSVSWDMASTTEVRDFVRWLQSKGNPQRERSVQGARPAAGTVNAVTGKSYLRDGYAPRTINHALSVVGAFYTFAYEAGIGPWNPVPSSVPPTGAALPRRARYRQKVPLFQPRSVSEELLQQLFAVLANDRDRALVAVALSSGARASELLSITTHGFDAGQGVVAVEPKGALGTRVWIPAAPESFVWIARYLASKPATVDAPVDGPLWRALRSPGAPLTYYALRQVLERANHKLGTNLTWHDFRHTFAHRILSDDRMTLTDAQALMRHRSLSSMEHYATSRLDELVSAFYRHLTAPPPAPATPGPAFDAQDLATLFPGMTPWA